MYRMEFPKRKRNQLKIVSEEMFLHDLQLYTSPPKSVTSVDRIVDICLQRVKALKIIEKVNNSGKKMYSDEWKSAIVRLFEIDTSLSVYYSFFIRQKSFVFTDKNQDQNARFEDSTAHFILLAFFARNSVYLNWFLTHELQLFRLRYASLSEFDMEQFKTYNDFPYFPLSYEEKCTVKQNLITNTENCDLGSVKIYKIPFIEVPKLVETRNVYVCKGFAYVPEMKLVEYFSEIFSSKMEYHAKHISKIREFDDQIETIFEWLKDEFRVEMGINKDDSPTCGLTECPPEKYPLCMRSIHQDLLRNHHLKHGARMQYGLFKMGLGIPFEEALKFWKDHFTKKIAPADFDKMYAYSIKHMFGLVGRRRPGKPYDCQRIQNSCVSFGENHGCPFRHWNPEVLREKLAEYDFNSEDVSLILELKDQGRYGAACAHYFQVENNRTCCECIVDPIEYVKKVIKCE